MEDSPSSSSHLPRSLTTKASSSTSSTPSHKNRQTQIPIPDIASTSYGEHNTAVNPSFFSTCPTAVPITNDCVPFPMNTASSAPSSAVVEDDLDRLVDFQYYPQIVHHSSTVTAVHGINYSALIMPVPQHWHPSAAQSLCISPSITNASSMVETTSAFSDRQWDLNGLHQTSPDIDTPFK